MLAPQTPQTPQDRAFPFVDGRPVAMTGPRWLVVLAGMALAYVLLVAPWMRIAGPWGLWLPPLLFCAVPLGALALVAGRGWTALFRRVTWRDVALMVGIAALNLVVTLLVGAAVASLQDTAANPLFQTLGDADTSTRVQTFAAMVPQLLGEELLTILPFLALLWWLVARRGMRRGTAVVLAWLLSALPFALLHLPTYQWDLLQCLAIIGTARLVLSLGYLLTRNLWVSTGAHVLNDWTLFGMGLLASAVPH